MGCHISRSSSTRTSITLDLEREDVTPLSASFIRDHAQLFLASPLLLVLDPLGAKIRGGSNNEQFRKYYPDEDKYHAMDGSPFKMGATNIYKTKDGRFYHLHG